MKQPPDRKHRPDETADLQSIVEKLGVPFAKALALFVKEAARPDKVEEGRQEVMDKLTSSRALTAAMESHVERVVARNNALAARGELDVVELGAGRAKKSLKDIARAKGISQKTLAERVNMDPAAVSRVLKHPDRSRVSTVRKIAEALEVDIAEVV